MPQFCLEGLSGPIEIAYIFGGRNYNMMRKEVVLSPKEEVSSEVKKYIWKNFSEPFEILFTFWRVFGEL